LRHATNRPNITRYHPDNLSLLGNEHHFVILFDIGNAGDTTVPLTRLDVFKAESAPSLHAIFV